MLHVRKLQEQGIDRWLAVLCTLHCILVAHCRMNCGFVANPCWDPEGVPERHLH